MCKYCENLYSGNSCEYLNLSKIAINGVEMMNSMSFLADQDDRSVCLETIVMDMRGEIVARDAVKVGWCPMCGREIGGIMS